VRKKFANGTTIRVIILMAIACIFNNGFSAMAEAPLPPAADSTCGKPVADEAQNLVLLTKLMLEPHKFNSLADLVKSLPPEAMAKIAAMQKTALERQSTDWPNLCRYAAENAQVKTSGIRPRVIFLGDSITENWKLGDPELFGPTVLDRGIGGQTTPQILLRFYQDVVALHPRVVHIMAGVNDIMGNTGATSDATIIYNIRAMIDIAKANGIRVVLASVTPSKTFVARPNVNLVPRITSVNRLLEKLAAEQHITFVNYVPSLSDRDNGLVAVLSNDGLHPNRDGYAIMRPLALEAISRAGK
jgi:lysophospholipase L1-like esterase